MKLITFAIPSYNSAEYMNRCIDSILAIGTEEEMEIIIVNDGSSDNTGEIADDYVAKYPNTIKAIHQENGGHGEGVNQGIRNATGLYFKIVDSDDWLDIEDGRKLMADLRQQLNEENPVDLYVCNYVYEHVVRNKQSIMSFSNAFPKEKTITWDETKPFYMSQYLLMHTMYYRTEVLRESGLVLPKHTFYVDNLFAYLPLPYVKTLRYLKLNVYRYFIGRDDQSVNEVNMIKRIDQQFRVTNLMLEASKSAQIKLLDKKLQRYLSNYMRIIMAVSMAFAFMAKTPESYKMEKDMWKLLKEVNPEWYSKLKYRSILSIKNTPDKMCRPITLLGYRVAQRFVGFN